MTLTLNDIVAIVKPHNDKIVAEHKLDLAWQRVNAKLDACKNRNDYDAGEKCGLESALWIIEELGGQDPVKRLSDDNHMRCCGTPEPQYNCPETVAVGALATDK